MPKAVNKVILIGNVGADPEIRTLSSGGKVANFSLATNRRWKDSDGTEQEKTEWHRITCWGKLADIIQQWVHKGDALYVEGRIEYSTAEVDGVTRYYTNIVAQEISMLGGRADGERAPRDSAPKAEKKEKPLNEPDDELPF